MNALKITTAWLAGSSLPHNGRFDGQKPLLGGTRNSVDQFEGQSDDQLNNQFDDLASRLSNQASIKLPGSDGWDELVTYAASPRLHPGFTVVVEVATESDIQATIEHANQHDLPFLAVSGYHSVTSSLQKMDGGIQINMRKMNSIDINEDENTVRFGGGALQYEVVPYLAEHGKQTVTGFGGCVSVIGPLLGGGHGILQGRYGLAADNIKSARLVLANGSAVDVSETLNPDLFWAIRGAGHNFGVVSSFEMKTYDIPQNDLWTFLTFVFSIDQLEDVLEVVNGFTEEGQHPEELVLLGAIVRIPDFGSEDPFISYSVIFQGTPDEAEPFAGPFKDLGPLFTQVRSDITYDDLTPAAGFDENSLFCQKNNNLASFPTSVSQFNISAMREAVDLFAELTSDPSLQQSAFILESYGMIGTRKFDEISMAVAREQRERDIFTFPLFLWQGDDEKIRQKAETGAIAITDVIKNGADELPYSYLNHAHGHESLAEKYGNDEWRLEKLRLLKREWDPQNKFGFYNPLV